jgi:hypothetical protein
VNNRAVTENNRLYDKACPRDLVDILLKWRRSCGEWWGRLAGRLAGTGRGSRRGNWWGSLAGEAGEGRRGRIGRISSSTSTLVFRLLLSLPHVDTSKTVYDVHRAVPGRLHPVKSPFFKTPDNHVPIQMDIMSNLRNILKNFGKSCYKL